MSIKESAVKLGAAGSVVLALGWGATFAAGEAGAAAATKVLATVNGVPITQADYDSYLSIRPKGANTDQKTILEDLIERELILEDAHKTGIEKNPSFIAQSALIQRALLVNFTLRAALEATPVTEEEEHKFYDSHVKGAVSREYKARHILVASEGEAKAIIAALDKGADFATLAKEKSKDNAASGGELGWFSTKQMVAPFSNAVATLAKGKYTTQPVHTEFGWHVVLLEDTRDNPPPSFEEVKEQIGAELQRMKLQQYMQQLQSKAAIKIIP